MKSILSKTKAAILANLRSPSLASQVQEIATAGKAVMFEARHWQLFTFEVAGSTDVPNVIGSFAAFLVGHGATKEMQKASIHAAIPASVLLMCDALDAMDKADIVKVTPDFLARCSTALSAALFSLVGVSPSKLSDLYDESKTRAGLPDAASLRAFSHHPAATA